MSAPSYTISCFLRGQTERASADLRAGAVQFLFVAASSFLEEKERERHTAKEGQRVGKRLRDPNIAQSDEAREREERPKPLIFLFREQLDVIVRPQHSPLPF